MRFYGADGQAGDVGDFGELKLVQKAQQEDVALALGELSDALPYQGQLLVRDQTRLQRAVAMRNVRGDIGDVDGGLGDSFPEAEAIGPGMVTDEIEGDSHEPGQEGAVSAEAGAGVPAPQKSVRRRCLGRVGA